MTAVSLYPVDIRVIGQPASHGTADVLLDCNAPELTRVVLTADLVASLHHQLAARLPLRLVSRA